MLLARFPVRATKPVMCTRRWAAMIFEDAQWTLQTWYRLEGW